MDGFCLGTVLIILKHDNYEDFFFLIQMVFQTEVWLMQLILCIHL